MEGYVCKVKSLIYLDGNGHFVPFVQSSWLSGQWNPVVCQRPHQGHSHHYEWICQAASPFYIFMTLVLRDFSPDGQRRGWLRHVSLAWTDVCSRGTWHAAYGTWWVDH